MDRANPSWPHPTPTPGACLPGCLGSILVGFRALSSLGEEATKSAAGLQDCKPHKSLGKEEVDMQKGVLLDEGFGRLTTLASALLCVCVYVRVLRVCALSLPLQLVTPPV